MSAIENLLPERTGVRAAAKAATRHKVLAAAFTCFTADGYEATTMRGIASHMGMSTGAIFAHFADKAELYRTVFGGDPISPERGRELHHALGFAISVIKSGEPWTETCEREIGDVFRGSRAT